MSEAVEYKSTDAVVRRRSRIRWGFPITIIILGLIGAIFTQFGDIEGNFRFPITLGVGLLTLLVLTLWVLVSGLRWKTKLVWVLAEVLPIVGLVFFVSHFMEMRGSWTGAGVPKFVFKGSQKVDTQLAAHVLSTTAPAGSVDLATTTPADWPQFLGPQRTNEVPDPGLSRDWTSHPPRQLWRQPVGAGWGSFAVVNGFAVHEEQRGPNEITSCLDARTGVARWEHLNNVRFSEGMGGDGPRATPTIVEGKVYVMGATGMLDCLDGATGNVIWSRNILKDAETTNLIWGKSCSPLIYEKYVIVTGGDRGPCLMAYDKKTGELAWRGGTDKSAYCSPTLATLAGKKEFLIVNAHSVTGHDVSTGQVLWTYPWAGDFPKVSQVVPFDGDRALISAGYGLGGFMLHVSPGQGESQSVNVLWSSRKLKTEFTNVAVRDGYIYGLDDGVLTCLKASDGAKQWRGDSYGHGQILLAGDLLLVQGESGEVAMVEATPKVFNELGKFTALTSKTWNNPTLYGKLLLVRNDLEAACFELP